MSRVQELQTALAAEGIPAGTIDESTLVFRITSIHVDTSKTVPDVSDFYNSTNVLAVKGSKPGKVHLCKLIGGIPYSNLPDPNKHIVYEWHYSTLKDEDLPDTFEMPKAFPKKLHGFAMLQIDEQPAPIVPGTPSLTAEFPEQNQNSGQFLGTEEGGVAISKTGSVEIVTDGGSNSLSLTEKNVDMGQANITSNRDGFTNWLMIKNPFRDGNILGAAMPNVLPLFPVAYDPFPNIPGIIEMYLRVQAYKTLVEGIKNLKDELEDLRESF